MAADGLAAAVLDLDEPAVLARSSIAHRDPPSLGIEIGTVGTRIIGRQFPWATVATADLG